MLFEELGKLKRSSIMTSIIFMAVGIVMIMCPAQYVKALVSTITAGAGIPPIYIPYIDISDKSIYRVEMPRPQNDQ